MAIDQDITNLPTPPSRSDSPSDFSDKADTFLAALPQLQTELNTYADEANATQQVINTSESNAATSETNAEDWASKTDGIVLTTDYSAKAYAISDNLIPEGAAKEWAIKIGGTVDGTDFSAKKYAIDAESSASAAASLAGATSWSAGVTYDTNDAAIGSDGNTYRSLVDGNLGNDPVTGDGTKWLNLTGTADVTKAELTKTFAAGESASLTLSEEVTTAPVVSVTKEVPQTGVTSNDWDVASDGANYTLHDTAYDTTLTPGEVGYQLSNGSYNDKFLDISAQTNGPESVFFKPDGTQMYIAGQFPNSSVYQYSLSTAWDITTASFSSEFSVASQASVAPRSVFIRDDGTKMYVSDNGNAEIYQYTLSTAWDILTASYDNLSFSVSGQDAGGCQGVYFKSDGTKMYVAGADADAIFEYALSVAWDVSTASYSSVSLSVLSEDDSVASIFFKNDGLAFYIVGFGTNKIYEYIMSSAWDLSTASYSGNSFSVDSIVGSNTGQPGRSNGLYIGNDGTRAYVTDSDDERVYQFSISSIALILGTGSFASEDVGKRIVGNGGEAILTAADGSFEEQTTFNDNSTIAAGDWSMFALDVESAAAGLTLTGTETVATSFDLSTASYDSVSFDVSSQDSQPRGIEFNTDGTKMYVIGNATDSVYQYSLTTSFDLSTASYDNVSFSVSGQDSFVRGIAFNTDGTKMYISGLENDSVYQYALSTPFELSTASYDSVSFSVSGQDEEPSDIRFNTDGTKMYIAGFGTNFVYQYSLSTAFDLSTASYDNVSFDVSDQDRYPFGITFNNDGTKMYMGGESSASVYQYTLSTAFDLNTASYDNVSFSVSGQDQNPRGIRFNTNGTGMYMVGASDSVYQYTTGTLNYFIPTSTNHTAVTSTSTNTEFWTDINSMTVDDASNDGAVYYAVSTDDRTTWSIVKDAVANETETLAVTVATGTLYQGGGSQGNVFYIEGNENPPLGLTRGNTYVFDQSDASNSNHPLRFQLTDGTSYTDGVTTNGTPGTAGANTTFVVPNDAPDNLEYYCSVHGIGMGGPVDVHDVRNAREIARDDSGQWQVNDASGYLTEIWVPTTENDEFYALEEAVDVDTAQSTTTEPYGDVNFWSYDNKEFDVSGQDGALRGVEFNNGGTKMYMVGLLNDSVYQYTLTTAFDISTASYDSVSFDLSAQSTNPNDIKINNDGTKMYITDNVGDAIFQYSLSTPFDLSTASYDSVSFSVLGEDGTPRAITFSTDGTKMYMVGNDNNSAYQYSLTTPFDLSTASYDSVSFSISSQDTDPRDISFNLDGTKMYILTNTTSAVYQYSLSTPFDIQSSSYTGLSFNVSDNPVGMEFDEEGSKVYVTDSGVNKIYQYDTLGQIPTSINRMDATQLNAVSDANHYTLGNDLDLAITLFMADGNTNSPTSDGVSINYDGNVVNQGAVLGTDYEFDKPTNTTVRVTALSDENLKVRVL